MKLTVDCKVCCCKQSFLTEIKSAFDEMYSLNYDALIDGARGADSPTEITIANIESYEDEQDLREIFRIIEQENPLVKIKIL